MKRRALRWMKGALIGACAALLVGCGADGAPARGGDGQADSGQELQEQPEDVEKEGLAEEEDRQDAQKQSAAEENRQDAQKQSGELLEDGIYTVAFDTDSSMFHLNESCEGRAKLTVAGGEMTVHVPLVSKSIVNLFLGTASEAGAADASEWLQPVVESVTYSDGYTEEVYAFDVPVPAIGVEFELALIGTKGKWYDHMVCVTDPQPAEGEDLLSEGGKTKASETGEAKASGTGATVSQAELEYGTYRVKVTLSGGTGRADIVSPAKLTVSDEGIVARITWSSPCYDYMLVEGVKYEPVNTDGNSVFEIPVAALDVEIPVTADTVAMSVPHEIAYTLVFDSASAKLAEQKK